jgi:hypothetical protein
MSLTVCLLANGLYYPQGGGHLWVYLNWALGLRALGCQVIWLELISPSTAAYEVQPYVSTLKSRLERYDLAECTALCSWSGEPLPRSVAEGCQDLDAAVEADLLLSLAYDHLSPEVLQRFRRSALVDIDPGLTQIWMSEGQMVVGQYDVYFTIGETVGQPGALFPDCGLRWHYTPPPVFLAAWPPIQADSTAPYTTVTHWGGKGVEFQGRTYLNGKRDGFLPFLDLPRHTTKPLELAVQLKGYNDERALLQERGWRVRDAHAVAFTPWDYQRYIQDSFGEFSCAKPSYTRLQTSWISDRTLCYLASGKPAVAQHTGPSRFLPDSAGLFRFRNLQEAVFCLETVASDYERQCRFARALAEGCFDAQKVIGRVLERALA